MREKAAAFKLGRTVFRETSLPGRGTVWPREVRVDRVEAVVLEREDRTSSLPRSQHRVEGALRWKHQADALPASPSAAWVELWVRGQRVLAVRREANAVWLGD